MNFSILLSVVPGKKKWDLTAGERRLFASSKERESVVKVPKNRVATKQTRHDFLVHRPIPLGLLGSDSGNILIYVGMDPEYKPGSKKHDGMMFDDKVVWHSSRRGEDLQTLCDLPMPDNEHLKVYVIVHGPNEARPEMLKAVAESLKLVKLKNPVVK